MKNKPEWDKEVEKIFKYYMVANPDGQYIDMRDFPDIKKDLRSLISREIKEIIGDSEQVFVSEEEQVGEHKIVRNLFREEQRKLSKERGWEV